MTVAPEVIFRAVVNGWMELRLCILLYASMNREIVSAEIRVTFLSCLNSIRRHLVLLCQSSQIDTKKV